MVEGYGSEPRFVLPRAPEGVVFIDVCSSSECRSDAHVDLGNGHYPAFGSVDVVTLAAMKVDRWRAQNAVNMLLGELTDADTERARVLRARYLGLDAFVRTEPGNDTQRQLECDSLESALDQIPPKSTDAETLYWTGRGARECASVPPASPEQAARLRRKADALLARVPPSSGPWASRAAAARATLRPATGGASLVQVKKALDRIPPADAADPLVQLDVLAGYACPAKDAGLVASLVTELRASSSAAKSWLPLVAVLHAEALEKCAATP